MNEPTTSGRSAPGSKPHEGREYWRSLESLSETPEFKEFLHREFPQNAPNGSIRRSSWLPEVDGRVAGARGCERLHAPAD
jgi:molybdopterin-containing oxidoreductase family iron-sulfur binding subunit